MSKNGNHSHRNSIYVYDRYHSLWFPLWCISGIALISWKEFSFISNKPFILSGGIVLGIWAWLVLGTWMSTFRRKAVGQIILGTAGYTLLLGGPMLSHPMAATISTIAGLLVLLSMPGRPDGFPETGSPSTEWICGGLLAFQFAGPQPIPMLGYIVVLRFISGLLFRFVPVHRRQNRFRTVFETLSWLPVGFLLASSTAADFRIWRFLPAAAVGIRLIVHIEDGISRLKVLATIVPRGFRAGLFRTFLIYYRIPFRRIGMKIFYGSFLPDRGHVWDVGAHLGNRSRIWLDLGLHVTAFEPQPACSALLTNWFGSCDRFTLYNKAIGSTSGKQTLHLSGRYPTLASTSGDWVNRMSGHSLFYKVKWEKEIEVEQTSLSEIAGKSSLPDFVKVDVEGSEASVFQGMDAAPAALSFEFLPLDRENRNQSLEILCGKAKWKWNIVVKERFRFVFPEPVDRETLETWLDSRSESAPSGDIYGWRIDEKSTSG